MKILYTIILFLFCLTSYSQTFIKHCHKKKAGDVVLHEKYIDKDYAVLFKMYNYFIYDLKEGIKLSKDYRRLQRIGKSDDFLFFQESPLRKGASKREYHFGVLKHFKDEVILDYDSMSVLGSMIQFNENGLLGLLDSTMTVVVPAQFNQIINFDDYFLVKKRDKWGVIDKDGQVRVKVQYDRSVPYTPFVAFIKKIYNGELEKGFILFGDNGHICGSKEKGTYIVYNKNFKLIDTIKNCHKFDRGNGIYNFKKTDKKGNYYWIFITSDGRFVSKNKYKRRTYFMKKNESLRCVDERGQYGVIDMKEQVIIPFMYDYIKISPNKNSIIVRKNKKYGLINYENKILVDYKYEDLSYTKESSIIKAKLNGKFGLISSDGKEIIPFIYDKIVFVDRKILIAKKDGLLGLIDLQNNVLEPFLYYLSYNEEDYIALIKKIEGGSEYYYFDFDGRKLSCPNSIDD